MNTSQRYGPGLLAVIMMLGACASSNTSEVYKDSELANTAYSNFLVVGIAGNYNARAQFEREVVTRLESLGTRAAAFYSVAGGDKLVNRDSVRQALAGGTFDAVILARALDRDTKSELVDPVTGTKVSRKEGGGINLFRYDYEDLRDPPALKTNTSVAFQTDLYSVADEKLVWSIQSKTSTFDNVGELIDDAADTIVNSLKRDGLLAR